VEKIILNTKATKIRVTYKDTDQMGISYYGNYFTWFEIARTEYFRNFGIVYKKLEEQGYYLPVVSAACQYKAPVFYDDMVVVHPHVTHMGRSSLTFTYEVFIEGQEGVKATGETKHCFVNKEGKPLTIPEEIRKIEDKSQAVSGKL